MNGIIIAFMTALSLSGSAAFANGAVLANGIKCTSAQNDLFSMSIDFEDYISITRFERLRNVKVHTLSGPRLAGVVVNAVSSETPVNTRLDFGTRYSVSFWNDSVYLEDINRVSGGVSETSFKGHLLNHRNQKTPLACEYF